jgi:hypothetical protein
MANTTYQDKSLQKLLSFFGIAVKQTPNTKQTTLVPGKKPTDKDIKKGKFKVSPIDMPSDVQKAYQYFLQNFSYYQGNSPNNWRFQLYKDLTFMIKNSGIMLRAYKLYVDETLSCKDAHSRIIEIKAKDRKVEKYFYEWMDNVGFTNKNIKQIVEDLTLYGDSFYIHAIDFKEGITGISLIDPFLIKDKIAFNISSLGKAMEWIQTNRNNFNRFQSLQQIIDIIDKPEDMEDISLFYQTFLLGYELKYSVDDDACKAVPPWFVGSVGQGTTSSEFFPFSIPMFINSISLYKSYQTSMMLQDMLRVAAFPKEIITIKGGETLTPLDRELRVDQTRQFMENITAQTSSKDNISVGERIYTMEDLFDYTIEDPGVDLSTVGDIEMKLEDLMLSTGVPDSYLIPSRGSGLGGENASALYFNSQIFQRAVEGQKQALLEGIENSFRLHLAITGEFESEATEFELSIPVSNSMYTSDRIRQENDMLSLTLEMINSLGQAVGLEHGDTIPPDIIKDIILHYMPIEPGTLNKWVNTLVKASDEAEEEREANPAIPGQAPAGGGEGQPLIVPMTGTGGAGAGATKPAAPPAKKPNPPKKPSAKVERFVESYKKGDDKLIREAYFETKRRMGFTNRFLGKNITINNTYKILHERKDKKSYQYSIYSLVKKEKLFRERKLIEQELASPQKDSQ